MTLSRLLDTTPPRLFTVAACGSLKPAPDGRLRGAYPHLLCSSALPLLVVRSRRTLVEVPAIARPRTAAAQPSCNHRSELQHPTPDRFIGNIEPALGEQFLDVAIAQGETQIKPDRVLDDHRRKAMAAVAERSHADILSVTLLAPDRVFHDNAGQAYWIITVPASSGSTEPMTPAFRPRRRRRRSPWPTCSPSRLERN